MSQSTPITKAASKGTALKKYSYKRMFHFLKEYMWPYKGSFLVSALLSSVSSAFGLYPAFAFAVILNYITTYTPGTSLEPLYIIFGIWIINTIVVPLANFSSRYIGFRAANQVAIDAQLKAIEHLSRIDIAWHENENTGSKIARIQRGAKSIVDLIRIWLGTIIDVVINFIGALFIISRFDGLLAILLVVYLVIYYVITTLTRLQAVKAVRYVNIEEEKFTGFISEIVANIRSVKVMGMADQIIKYAHVVSLELIKQIKRRIFWFQSGGGLRVAWEGAGRILMIIFILWGIMNGRYEVGFLVLAYGYFNTISRSTSNLSEVTQDIATANANVGRLIDILDEPITIDKEENKVDFPKDWDGIHIKNLAFTYGDNIVLNGISLDIKKGEKVGIVGLSGAGKTTLFKLLLKEYENYSGGILIGNTSLKDVRKSSYVTYIATVLQDTEVFNLSLRENIVLSNSAQIDNIDLLERSLSISHVQDYVSKLQKGVETIIGEKGVKLSGGERQRLGIARAIFKQPEILFLDEATSHLDVESEQKIQDSLQMFFKDVTAVVIAHRLSTIREMDRIIVIDNGKILEEGSHDELLQKEGSLYKKLWNMQAGGFLQEPDKQP
jgi:ABC-type multidrug transport system fused ATPase/permease subunit